ncbi:MAG: DUF1015 domain-containing protein [Planctomycetota bacterium]
MPQFHAIPTVRFPDAELTPKIAPPYDVLDEGPKRALLERDPNNVVAIDLPVTPPKTVGPDAAYEQAAATMRDWLASGVLVRDDAPAMVAYEQVYDVDGQTMRRRGLFGGVGLEPFNQPRGVFRHEMTIAGGIGDRTKLTRATHAQLSPIFGVFRDPQTQVAELLSPYFDGREPDAAGKTDDGTTHRVWWVRDEAVHDTLAAFFADTEVYIADGHHRYTTALELSDQLKVDLPGAAQCLFVLVAAEDPGMIVLPTHRVLCGLTGMTTAKLADLLSGHDDFRIVEDVDAAMFGLYDPTTKHTVGVDPSRDDVLAAYLPDKPEVWRKLDVAILHAGLIERVFKPAFGPDCLSFKYTADADEMKRFAGAEPGRLGVVMRATPLSSVMDVSLANEVMPPKSTYFYPKMATGLVIHPLDR